jgi:hypothetical protein
MSAKKQVKKVAVKKTTRSNKINDLDLSSVVDKKKILNKKIIAARIEEQPDTNPPISNEIGCCAKAYQASKDEARFERTHHEGRDSAINPLHTYISIKQELDQCEDEIKRYNYQIEYKLKQKEKLLIALQAKYLEVTASMI